MMFIATVQIKSSILLMLLYPLITVHIKLVCTSLIYINILNVINTLWRSIISCIALQYMQLLIFNAYSLYFIFGIIINWKLIIIPNIQFLWLIAENHLKSSFPKPMEDNKAIFLVHSPRPYKSSIVLVLLVPLITAQNKLVRTSLLIYYMESIPYEDKLFHGLQLLSFPKYTDLMMNR